MDQFYGSPGKFCYGAPPKQTCLYYKNKSYAEVLSNWQGSVFYWFDMDTKEFMMWQMLHYTIVKWIDYEK